MYIYLVTLVALDVVVPASVSSTRYCFEYCQYVFYTKQPTLDPRCDCSAIAELLARFVSQSTSTLADHQALTLPQAASYPIKVIPYSEQRYLIQKPTSKNPLMKETDEIKIKNITSSIKRSKKGKCKKRNESKTDKLVVEKHKNYTVQSDKEAFKIPRIRKPDSVVGSEFDRNTVPIQLNLTQSHISNVNESDVVQDKHGLGDSHENNNTSIEAHRPVLNILINNSIENITTKQQSDYFKEQNSQLTINTTDHIVFLTNNSKPTDGNDTVTMPFVFKFHNDEVMPTIELNPLPTTTKTSENNKNTTSTYINDSATVKNDINRETYNEREVPLQKIITKELTNGSVISYINGTENLLYNEFSDNNSSNNIFLKGNFITDFKNDKPPQLLPNSTKSAKSGKTPIVSATFNFIFVSIPSKLEEISDDKILS